MSGVAFTGYARFPGVADNPSQRLIEALERSADPAFSDCSFHLLETEYATAPERLLAVLARRPRALVMTGYSAIARGLKLENVATDFCSPEFADASGFAPAASEAQVQRLSSPHVEFEVLKERLERAEIPCHLSDDAGSYVCNHGYFTALSHLAERGETIPVLFVHIPALTGSALAERSASEMTLEEMVRAMAVVAGHFSAATS